MPKLLCATTENLVPWTYRHLEFVYPWISVVLWNLQIWDKFGD